MTAMTSLNISRRDRHTLLFQAVAGLIAVGLFLVDGVGVLAPWFDMKGYTAPYEPALQRWYDARWGACAGILLIGSLLALLWRPDARPLLLQFLVLAGAAASAIGLSFDPYAGVLRIAAIALLVGIYPRRELLTHFSQPNRLSRPLLALSLTSAALLALDAWLSMQLAPGGTRAIDRPATEAIVLAAALALSGLLAATKRPGWQALGLLSGAALIYLGLAAAKLPAQPGAWGGTGAALATLGGWAFVGATWWQARSAPKDRADRNSVSSLTSK
jgi:hypothetical protein